MSKKQMLEKILELMEENEKLKTMVGFNACYYMYDKYYLDDADCDLQKSNIAMEYEVNRMIRDGYKEGVYFNGTFDVQYFCCNLYRQGYRKCSPAKIDTFKNIKNLTIDSVRKLGTLNAGGYYRIFEEDLKQLEEH